jgi:hypothetical protein
MPATLSASMRIKGACIRRLLKFSDPVRRWRRNPAVRLQLVVFRHLQRVDAAQRLGIAVEYRDIGAHAARLLHCIQKTQPVFEFTAQSVAPRL